MADVLYSDLSYCSACDRYFPGDEARAEHVQMSTKHPKCDRCERRFANMNSLRNHWVYSPRHHYCVVCEKDFSSSGGLRVHMEMAAVHRDDSDDEDEEDDDIDDTFDGWEDEVARNMYPDGEEDDEPASDDEDYSAEDEYWDEDDETEFEEDRDAYYGFASVSAVGGELLPAVAAASAPTAGESSTQEEPQASFSTKDSGQIKPVVADARAYGCPLCLEAPQDCSATHCGHIFCTPCIDTALESRKMCPVCRKFACHRQLRKVFLPVVSV
ncbi:unnamed protein product [Somion occarium]|uniref:RING-type domain-containing protein n=1 Tax=Somion occarium TaxID=3059160 RepID=A0ABP1DLC9_9APHY